MRCARSRVQRIASGLRLEGSRRASQISRTRSAPTVRAVVVVNAHASFAQARNRLDRAMDWRPPNRVCTECPSKMTITDSIESISSALNRGGAESIVCQRVRKGIRAHGGCARLARMSARLRYAVIDSERSVSQPSISTCGPAASRPATAIPPAVLSSNWKLSYSDRSYFSQHNRPRSMNWHLKLRRIGDD